MSIKTTRKMTTGYAYQSTKRCPKEPTTVVVGQTEIDRARWVGTATIDDAMMCAFRVGKTYYFQTPHSCRVVEYDHARFFESDVKRTSSWDGALEIEDSDFVDNPLWFHKRGLMQTATGYGKRLKTSKSLWFENRLHRVYCCCYSNNGTCYIESKGRKIIVG